MPAELTLERISCSDTSVFSALVRKKNSVDDVNHAICVEDVTLRHCGIVHLKVDRRKLRVFHLRKGMAVEKFVI